MSILPDHPLAVLAREHPELNQYTWVHNGGPIGVLASSEEEARENILTALQGPPIVTSLEVLLAMLGETGTPVPDASQAEAMMERIHNENPR